MRNNAHTFVEVMVAAAILVIIFGAIFAVFSTQDRSFRVGQDRLFEQQQARRAMDKIVLLLRQAKPGWVGISADQGVSTKILSYKPTYNDVTHDVDPGAYVIFKLNVADPTILVKKEADIDASFVTLANDIVRVNFGGGCAGCAAFNCMNVDNSCPVIKVDIETNRAGGFALTSFVSLRNNAPAGAVPVPPPQGEF